MAGQAVDRSGRAERRATAGALAAAAAVLLVLVSASSAATPALDGGPVDGARPAFAAVWTAALALLAAAPGLLWLRHLTDSAGLPRSGLVVAAALGAATFLVLGGGTAGVELFSDPAGGFGTRVLGARSAEHALALAGAVVAACLALRVRPTVRQGIVLGLAAGLGVLVVETGLMAAAIAGREEALIAARRPSTGAGPLGWVLVGSRWGLAGIGVDAAAAALLGATLAVVTRRRLAIRSLVLPAALAAVAAGTLFAWGAAPDLAYAIRLAIEPGVQPRIALLDFRLTGITMLLIAGPALLLAAILWRRGAPGEALVAQPRPAPRQLSWPVAALAAALATSVVLEADRMSALLDRVLASEVVSSTVMWWYPGAMVAGFLLSIPAALLIAAGARRAAVPARAIVMALLVMALLVVISGGLPITILARALGTGAPVKSVTITPGVEELTKLLAILLGVRTLAGTLSVRTGIVVGAVVGLAFNLVEVAVYVQSDAATQPSMVASTFAVRMADGGIGLHVATASVLGGAFAAACRPGTPRPRATVLALGLAVALATHGAWNAFAADLLNRWVGMLDPKFPAAPPAVLAAYAVGTAVTWLLTGPALAAVTILWWRSGPGFPPVPEPLPGTSSEPPEPSPAFDTRSESAISSPGRTRAVALFGARRVCVPPGVGASGSQGRTERITDSPDGQADISAQEATSRQDAWVPRPDEDPGWPARARDAAREGPEAALGLTDGRSHNPLRLVMLSRPGDFARLAEGGVARTHPLLVGRFVRTDLDQTRFGFATGKRLGGAVIRNRVRRRIREVLRVMAPSFQPGWDVLIIARPAIVEADHDALVGALRRVLRSGGVLGGRTES